MANKYPELENKCNEVRHLIIDSVFNAGSGHPGGSLSATDLAVVLFEKYLKFNAKNLNWDGRDYFILSKGHAAPLLYSILALKGVIEMNELNTLRKLGSRLQGHPDALKLPGVEVSTGSLGQGFGVAAGIALSLKTDQKIDQKVYALLGDGELQEGTIWETAMAAAHYKLGNLCAIIDANKFQIDGKTEDIMNLGSIKAKFESFGWKVVEIDGHKINEIDSAYSLFLEHDQHVPFAILANTIKGKGISFMENTEVWHGKAPEQNEYDSAKGELGNDKKGEK